MKTFLLVFLLVCSAPIARAQSPVVHATLTPQTGIIVGEPVRLTVTVLVPTFFTEGPQFPAIDLENAVVVQQDDNHNTREQIDGSIYAGIIQTYLIYAQQPGKYVLPAAPILITYSDKPPHVAKLTVPLQSLSFQADIPAQAQGLSYFLPTTRLTMQQTWDPALKNLRAGATVQRSVVVTAANTQAMLIPPLLFDAPDGVRIYAKEAHLEDQKTPYGQFIAGQRSQTVRYFIAKSGDYTLPGIELKWWNLNTRQLVTAKLPAVHFFASESGADALPPPLTTIVSAEPAPVSFWRRHLQLIIKASVVWIAGLLMFRICWHYGKNILQHARLQRERRRHSEAALFRSLLRACKRSDPQQAYICLLRWRRQEDNDRIDLCPRANDSRDLQEEIENLGAKLYSAHSMPTWNGKRLSRLLRTRHKMVHSNSRRTSALPKLNP
jgi:hypothetical protein